MRYVIYARADVPENVDEPDDAPVVSLNEAIKIAKPGAIIKLLPGRFTTKIQMRRKHGRDGAPIIIQGTLDKTIIDGLVDPFKIQNKRKPKWWTDKLAGRDLRALREEKCPMLRMENCSWIEFRDLSVVRCWPHFLHIRSSHHLTVAGCHMVGGKGAIFVSDMRRKNPSHHILIENNAWCQDPTGQADPTSDDPSDRRIWQEWVWHQFKKSPCKKPWAGDARWEDLRFMNGGFVVGEDFAGTVIIRHNQIRFAFNAILLKVYEDEDKRQKLRPEDLGSAPAIIGDPNEFEFNYEPPDLSRNTNVEIYENTIEYIRDNAVEPEYGSKNWWVWNNRIRNTHKAISIHNNGGGFWYYFGNVCGHDAVPPAQLKEPPEWQGEDTVFKPRKLGGSIFKLLYGPPMPELPCFAFHNSWRPRGSVMNDGELRHFNHFNNAVEHCAPDKPADLHCDTPLFARSYIEGEPMDYGFVTCIPPLTPDAVNQFDHDVSTGVDFPKVPRSQGQETKGLGSTDIFDQKRRAEYILSDSSPARGAAKPFTLRSRVDWPAAETWSSEARDVGAVQHDGHFNGPIFAHAPNRHYDESPRLVGIEGQGRVIKLVFSIPFGAHIPNGTANLELLSGTTVRSTSIGLSGRRLTLSLKEDVAPDEIIRIYLPKGFSCTEKRAVTGWAAIIPLSIG